VLSKLDSFILTSIKVLLSVIYVATALFLVPWCIAASSIGIAMYVNNTPIPHINGTGSQILWATWIVCSAYLACSIVFGLASPKSRWSWVIRKLWNENER
jgi:hypothetical protein